MYLFKQNLKGSFTIEATIIIPIILFLIASLISISIKFYTIASTYQMSIQKSIKAYYYAEKNKVIDSEILLEGDQLIITNYQKDKSLVKISEATMYLEKPVQKIRVFRSIKRLVEKEKGGS